MNVVHYLKYVSDHNFCLTWVLVSDDWSQWSLSEGCFTQVKQGFKLIHGEISPGCFFDCKASCIGMLHTSLFAWQSLHKHLPWKLYGKIQSWLVWQHFRSRPNGTVVKIEICMRSNSGTPLLALLNFLVLICRKVKDHFVFRLRWVTKTSEWQFIFVKTKVLVTFFVQMITQTTVGFELQHESCDYVRNCKNRQTATLLCIQWAGIAVWWENRL